MNNFEFSILWPALCAALLVLATHVPLGIDILKRGIIFVDLAIAQIAGLGALAATLYLGEEAHEHLWIIQGCSLIAALGGAFLLTWLEKRFPEIQEALIGSLFVFAASLALLLLGQNPHGGEHMKDLLAGQILWVSTNQLVIITLLYAPILAIWFTARGKLSRIWFYILFAFAVTASVQLVGVYLVFASLILPALTSRSAKKYRLAIAYSAGIVSLVMGLGISIVFDYATGPTVVCVMSTLTFIIIFIERSIWKR